MLTVPTDIEHAITELVALAQDAARTGSPTAHSMAAIARVTLDTIIAAHLVAYAEMKAALEAQTSAA